MRISVAMCTYNGARFLPEQLASIASQTRPPDELVVCDDRSSDDTVGLIRRTPMPCPVRLSVNEMNLGSTANFERAIGLCTGDVIALSDQDDVWRSHKLTRVEQAFRDDPGLGLFASDAVLIDERSRPEGGRLWATIPFGWTARHRFRDGGAVEQLTRCNVITGATAAFAARLREVALPIPRCWVHDGWIALLAAAVSRVRLEEEPLTLYRRHTSQQIGVRRLSFGRMIQTARALTPASYELLADCFAAARERLLAFEGRLLRADLPCLLRGRELLCRAQGRMRRGSRLARVPEVLGQVLQGHYARFGLGPWGWKTIAADLCL